MWTLAKAIFYIGQVIFSLCVILIGCAYGIRCLIAGQIFCAVCFGIMGYVSGYLMLFRASVAELREFYKWWINN